jgi:hypothetical protein
MGLLTKTVAEMLTDRLVSRLNALAFDNVGSMLAANTEEGLAAYLDEATADADLQVALLPSLLALDKVALRANSYTLYDTILSDTKVQAFCKAVDLYVRSTAGGSYANIGAWASAISLQLHPLMAEAFRKYCGESCFTVSSAIVGAVGPLQKTRSFDKVYTGAFAALVDDTTDAASTTTADVALFAADNDYLVLQARDKFGYILMDLSTLASSDVGLEATYWNGTAWATLTITDRTVGLSVNGGVISITMPTDMEPTNNDNAGTNTRLDTASEGEFYTVLLKRTTNTVNTPPVATWLQYIPAAVTNGNGKLYGIDQPPLALVRITGTNTCSVTEIQDPETSRFLAPAVANSEITLKAITAFAADITFTIGYKDQAGAASTQAQSAWTAAIAAGATKVVSLGADTALTELTGSTCTIVTAATSGAFVIEVSAYPRTLAVK